jgi:hypothetical protein
MMVNGERWLWDYANDCAVAEKDMPRGSDRRKASDKAKRSRKPAVDLKSR